MIDFVCLKVNELKVGEWGWAPEEAAVFEGTPLQEASRRRSSKERPLTDEKRRLFMKFISTPYSPTLLIYSFILTLKIDVFINLLI